MLVSAVACSHKSTPELKKVQGDTAPVATVVPANGASILPTDTITFTFSKSIVRSSLVLTGGIADRAVQTWATVATTDDTLSLTGVWNSGLAQIALKAADAAGSEVALTVNYTVLDVPVVTNIAPQPTEVLGGTQSITVSFSRDMDESSLALSGGLGVLASATWSSKTTVVLTPTTSWPNSATPSDTQTLTLAAKSAAAQMLPTTSFAYVVDAAPPTVISTSPQSHGTLGGPMPITISFSEPMTPASVAFEGTLAGRVGTVSWSADNATLTVPTTLGWPDGSGATLTVAASDAHGNALVPVTLAFDVDAVGPTITISPGNGALIDWTQALTVTGNEALSGVLLQTTFLGSLASGVAFSAGVAGDTLTLAPQTHWNADSGESVLLVVHDAYGNASAPLMVSYDVRDGGVYVRTSGSDSAPGTKSAPLKTIGQALAVVAAAYTPAQLPHVSVAEGTYDEQVVLSAGVQVLGGFAATDWSAAPSRTAHATTLQSAGTAVAISATVVMADASSLQRFTVSGTTNATSQCAAVRSQSPTTTAIFISDNTINGSTCSAGESIGVLLGNSGDVHLSGNTIHSGDEPGSAIHASRGVNMNGAGSVIIDGGGRVSTGTSNSGVARAIEASGGTALTIADTTVVAGSGTVTQGVNVTGTATISITGCRIFGGSATNSNGSSTGIVASATSTGHVSITGNYVHGGTPVNGAITLAIGTTSGTVLVANNVVTGGGTPGDTLGETDGITAALGNGTASIFNNTVHAGFRPFSRGIVSEQANVKIENNIVFFTDSAGTVSAAFEENGAHPPATLANNIVANLGSTGTVFGYMKYRSSGGNCPGGQSAWDCVPFTATDLNTATKTIAGAIANQVVDPSFVSLQSTTTFAFFDTNFAFVNDWSLSSSSSVKASGIDGAAAAPAYGFTTDFAGHLRTGNATTGWSPGAFETD